MSGKIGSFRPVLFSLNNDPESEKPLIEFLTKHGLTYLGKIDRDNITNYSRKNVFSFQDTDFRLVIYWMRNLSTIQYMPNGWDGAFMECNFDNIRECMTGYCDHTSLAFCYGDTEMVRLAIPRQEVA